MAEVKEMAEEDVLLEDILNALDITFDDEATRKKIRDLMHQGKARIEQLKGAPVDFAEEQMARMLLFAFCRYGRSNAAEQFEHDFACQLTAFSLEAAVAGMRESGADDENEV